jgi:toxin YoeB
VKIVFTEEAWDDYTYWQGQDRKTLKRINLLIKDILRGDEDNGGLGKPELLKGDLAGFASRRIDSEHRLVYRVTGDNVEVIACRYHYDD